jgi:hypothetical protein
MHISIPKSKIGVQSLWDLKIEKALWMEKVIFASLIALNYKIAYLKAYFTSLKL